MNRFLIIKVKKNNKVILSFMFILYIFISVFIYRSFLKLGIVGWCGAFAPDLDIFLKNVAWEPAWHEMQSKPTRGWLYSPHFIFYFLGKIIGYDVVTLIKLEYIFFCALSGFAMYILCKYLLKLSKIYEYVEIPSFLAGLLYMLNLSFRVGDAYYIGIQFAFSIFPLILYFFFKALHEKKYSYALICGFLWANSAAFDQRWVIAPLIVIFPYILINSVVFNLKRSILNFLANIKYLALTILIFILLGGYFFFEIVSTVTVGKTVALTKEAVDVTWSNANLINLMKASAHFQLSKYITSVPLGSLQYFVIPCGLLLVALSLATLLINTKSKIPTIYYYFLLLFIFILGLFVGFGKLSREFLYWLVLESPYHHFTGRLFRTTRIPDLTIATCISILLVFSLNLILTKIENKRILKYSVIFVTLVLILLASAPLLTGDVAGRLHPIQIPNDYKEANRFLSQQKGDFKVVWSPEFWGPFQPYWSKDVPMDALTYYGSSKPVYFARNNIFVHYYAYTVFFRYNSLLIEGQIEDLCSFLKPLNIKYIILHCDIPQFRNRFANVLNSINKSSCLKLTQKFGKIYIFEVRNYSKPVGVYSHSALVYGGLETSKKIVCYVPPIFGDQLKDDGIRKLKLSCISTVIISASKNINDLLMPRGIVIEPAHYSIYYQKDKWSRAYITDPHHGIWHGFINQFPNQKWEFGYGVSAGFVFIQGYSDSLKIPIEIKKDNKYFLFVRVLKNPKGGEIKINLANLSKTIDTREDIKAEFVWVKVGEIYLTKGKYTLKIENIGGSNAINILVLIPEKEYIKAKKEVEKLLQNKTIIYLFEAESDLYRSNAKTVKNIDVSNGELLTFIKSGRAWQDIEIVKNGTYRLALKGVGEFKVRIGDHEFILKANSLNFTYTPLFHLTKGKYRLEILASKDSYLDVIWLYSAKTNQTIDQLFEVKEEPAEIINYTKINPTLWKVKVNATKPFMLSFAEAYDPLWEVRVYKDGKLVEKVKSIPLYSIINGFWINETGNLEIVIRYTPQDWFELGLKISTLTFIGCIGYIFYDWRREKGDKWAKEIERRLSKTISKFTAKMRRK